MTLEMTTNWMHLIEPGRYGTNLGEIMENVSEVCMDDFNKQFIVEAENIINEIFYQPWFRNRFGICKAIDFKLVSPRFYNYENDRLDFNMEISNPDFFITYYERFKPHEVERFFEWSEKNYGSRPGFISSFPYTREKFEKAILSDPKEYDFSMAIGMLVMYAYEKCDEPAFYQREFEDNIDRYCEENGLYDFPDM